MYPVCIGLGSNFGNSLQLLQSAWAALSRVPEITAGVLSSPWLTEPVGMESEHWFINAAGVLQTGLGPESLLDLLLETEKRFGRMRPADTTGYVDRTLDLDLLLYGDLVMNTQRLVLPHPQMHCRLFVLAPLAEILPDQQLPLLDQTIRQQLAILLAQPDQPAIEQRTWST